VTFWIFGLEASCCTLRPFSGKGSVDLTLDTEWKSSSLSDDALFDSEVASTGDTFALEPFFVFSVEVAGPLVEAWVETEVTERLSSDDA
jgi:hypothetical protein